MPKPGLLTSYLNHPKMRKPIPGVLRVLVARRAMHFQRGCYDAHVPSATISPEASEEWKHDWFNGRERGLKELQGKREQIISDFDELLRQHPDVHTVILLCHEAKPNECHRYYVYNLLIGVVKQHLGALRLERAEEQVRRGGID